MPDDERLGLRYAVAAEAGQGGPELVKDAAYAGPHLLMVAAGIENMSSPMSPSKLAIDKLSVLDNLANSADPALGLEDAIADLEVTFKELLAGNPRWEGTGVMLTAMLLRGTQVAVGHIGNGRACVLRDGVLTQITRDHTFGQALIEEGLIGPAELGSDPRHFLTTRCIDGANADSAEVSVCEARSGDRYLLITGRAWHFISPGIIREILCDSSRDPQGVADVLMGEAFPVQPGDGFSCVVADVLEKQDDKIDCEVKLAGAVLRQNGEGPL